MKFRLLDSCELGVAETFFELFLDLLVSLSFDDDLLFFTTVFSLLGKYYFLITHILIIMHELIMKITHAAIKT